MSWKAASARTRRKYFLSMMRFGSGEKRKRYKAFLDLVWVVAAAVPLGSGLAEL